MRSSVGSSCVGRSEVGGASCSFGGRPRPLDLGGGGGVRDIYFLSDNERMN